MPSDQHNLSRQNRIALGADSATVDGTDLLIHQPDGSIDRLDGILRLSRSSGDDDLRAWLGDGGTHVNGGDGDDSAAEPGE